MLLNRINELKSLEEAYAEKAPKLIVLYGRRRVGKTALLMEFAEKHKVLYLLARQESIKDQLDKMSNEIADFFNDNALKLNPFRSYDALFTYLNEKDALLIFDEFPFLVESNKAVPSILQEYWDKYFSKKRSLIILCGSSVRMMESLLGYKSPLYGRRTEQMLLMPLKFKDACLFFPKLSNEEKVVIYAILGGLPAYLLEFDYSKDLFENIREKILRKNKFLYQDVEYVLKEELTEPSIYYSIIRSIATGNTKMGNIINDTGIEKGKISKYLSVLQHLHLVERRVPITEKNLEKSRKGIYLLRDNYFKFWFRFVFPNKEYIEQERQQKLIEEKIKPELNSFIGQAFEEIALDWIKQKKEFNSYLFGRWWDNNQEIDILGLDKQKNAMIIGEVKWKELDKNDAKKEIQRIKEKSSSIQWRTNSDMKFILIAKKIIRKKELQKEGFAVYDLEDMMLI